MTATWGRSQPRSMIEDLLVGPAVLTLAATNDLFLATRVFVAPDRLTGTLAYFIFGCLLGVPLQLLLARSALARRLDGTTVSAKYDNRAAAVTGALAAVATATWLYALAAGDASVVVPLANLSPIVFAVVEGAQRRVRLVRVLPPVLLLFAGIWCVRVPSAQMAAGLSTALVLTLVLRNATNVVSEVVERSGAFGTISRFTAMRFVWLAVTGVPVACGIALSTGRARPCLALIADALPLALPIHSLTMLLTFVGAFCRTRAKRELPLTICTAAYAAPLVFCPLAAALVNFAVAGFFPTVSGSARLLAAAALVVAGVAWLSTTCRSSVCTSSSKAPQGISPTGASRY